MGISQTLAFGSAFLHGAAYVIYNWQALKGSSVPNPATWGLSAILAILNALTFQGIDGNWLTSLQFVTGSLAGVVTFFYILSIGKFSKPKGGEYVAIGIGTAAGIVWLGFQNAAYANFILLFAFIVAVKPTFEGVITDPHKETALPWIIWTVAFILTIINLVVSESSGPKYIMPGVLLVAHLAVAVLCRKSRKDMFSKSVLEGT